MLKRFVTWCLGYVGVIIYGYFPERFLNLCNARKIRLWNVERTEEGYRFFLSVKDYKKLRPIVRKTKTRPRLIEKKGLPFFIKRFRPRVGLWVGALLFAGLLYGYSQFIWSIEFKGQYTHTGVELEKYLKTLQIFPGVKCNSLDCTGLEEALRKKYKDIGWVSAEIRGSKLLIQIRETNLVEKSKEDKAPAHLIAPAAGEIASVIVRKGTLTVRKGDRVEAGDILINGIVDIVGDNELLLRKEAVEADGDIYLNTWLSYYQEYPLKYKKKEYTGKIKKKYSLRCGNYEFSFHNPLKVLENWTQYDIIGEKRILYPPIEIFVREYREYEERDAVYSRKEILKLAKDWFSFYLEKLEEKKIKLLKNQVELKITKDKCIASGSLYVSEPVQTYRKITDSEWRNTETDEYSRNDN